MPINQSARIVPAVKAPRYESPWRSALWMFVITLIVCGSGLPNGLAATRTLEFETREVTQPTLSVATDGQSFVFNLLGHLFRLPTAGGTATQLTFGPYYDSEPVFSPDGSRIVFISNRDGSDGNLFALELASGKISQLTHEFQVGAPAWSPDGKTIAYISFLKREEYPRDRIPGFGAGDTGVLSTIAIQGGAPQRLSSPRTFVSLFYLPDGRLAWTIAERAPGPQPPVGPGMQAPPASTTIEVRPAEGAIARLGSLPGRVGRVALNPRKDGFYYVSGGELRQYMFGEAEPKIIGPFAGGGVAMAVAPDNKTIYAAADAKLWRVSLPEGGREQLSWLARVKMEVAERAVRKWSAPSASGVEPGAILTPRLSPDGRTLVFMAAGYLWEQSLQSGQARKIVDEASYQLDPAFSPDGKRLAFISDKQGKREVRVFDFATRQTSAIGSVGGYSWALHPCWSSDGKSVVVQRSDAIGFPYRFIRLNAQTASAPVELGQSRNNWNARPHFSADGESIYYTARTGAMGNVYRLSLQAEAKPEPVTDLTRHAHDGLVSPDGKWLAFRRNIEIWLAPMKSGLLKDQDFQRFSSEGGRSFAFTADASAIIYSEGRRVWRRSIQGGRATEIPIRLTLPRATSAPLLISRVRALDLQAGKFSAETSMLIEQGRIRWIGSETGRSIPSNVVRIDGAGRYAIPGLADSHTHAAWSNQQITEDRLIAYGVTSVRDVGSRLDIVNALRDRGEATNLPVPRYFASGDIFEGVMPLWGDAFLEITDKQEARDYVRRMKDLGASFIKVYASLPWYLKSEVAAEAARLGMPVAGHGLSVEEIVRSVNFGITSLEHGGPNNDDIVKLLASSGTWLDPTLTVFGAGTPLRLSDPATIDTKFRTFMPEDEIKAARPGRTVSDAQLAGWKNSLAAIRRVHEGGVKLLDGTDALMTGVFHGPSVHWALQFYSEAGIPAIDILRVGTIGAAETVGASADLGSLEPGKLGDVLLLDADPLANISNTMKIWRVIKGGHVFNPATMR